MDLTPSIPAGRQVIERYGHSGFRVAGTIWRGSILVFPAVTLPWAVTRVADLTKDSLVPVMEHGGVQVLLLGLGYSSPLLGKKFRDALQLPGIVLEPMDTGAACRTFNVLLAEDRRVAAALIPPV